MNLHLFSTPGKDDIRYILEASRPFLEGKDDPVIAYIPAASLGGTYQEYTEKAFRGLAHVATINTELMTLPEMETDIRNAALVYIPGGNTYLANHRLHISNILDYLRKKVTAGLPLIGFSAGTVLCGPNILTSMDLNTVESPHFSGLNVTPFNFSCHYPEDEIGRFEKDEWLGEYHVFHENPVIMLADGAYIRVEGKKTQLVQGQAWILRKGQEKQKLVVGMQIAA
ncbi:MAG: Type 1 glutamine amidotransferase-like domain-containing protein [Anaerolineales bacterium]|jgi:dipeptidase E